MEDISYDKDLDQVSVGDYKLSGTLLRNMTYVTPAGKAYRTVKAENGALTVQIVSVP